MHNIFRLYDQPMGSKVCANPEISNCDQIWLDSRNKT